MDVLKSQVSLSLIILSFLLSVSVPSLAHDNNADKGFFPYCSNNGSNLSFSFQSCVSSNFLTAQTQSGTYLQSCYASNDRADFFYTSCINNNFNRLASKYPDLFFSHCTNYPDTDVSFFFISCVNNNFSTLARKLP